MIDFDYQTEGELRPAQSVAHTVRYCLRMLIQDKVKRLDDEVVENLTYEELLGALLQARDLINLLEDELDV